MPASDSMVMFEREEPMAWKAALFGAKTVRSGVVSTASTSSALVRAPATELRPAAMAVVEMF